MNYELIKMMIETQLDCMERVFETREFSPSTVKRNFNGLIRDIEGLYNLGIIRDFEWKELHEMVFPVMMRLGIEVH